MEKPLVQKPSPGGAVFMYIMIWVFLTAGFSLAASYISALVLGQGAAEKMFSDPVFVTQHLWFNRLNQSLFTILTYLVPPFIFCVLAKEHSFAFLGISRKPSFRLLFISFLIILFALPFVYYTYHLNQQLTLPQGMEDTERVIKETEDKINALTKAMMTMHSRGELVFNLLMFAFLPAIGEEIFFRGGLQRLLARAFGNGHAAILITAMFFSAVHFEFYGYIPRLILAVIFGYMYYWSRNLWLPIFAHAIYNGYQVILVYLLGADKVDKMDPSDIIPYAAVCVSAILLFLSMSWLYRRTMGKWRITLEQIDD